MRTPVGSEAGKVTERRLERNVEPRGDRAKGAHRFPGTDVRDRLLRVGPIRLKLLIEQLRQGDGRLKVRVIEERGGAQPFQQLEVERAVQTRGRVIYKEVVDAHGREPNGKPTAGSGAPRVFINVKRHRCIPIRRLLPEERPADRWRPSDVDLLAYSSC